MRLSERTLKQVTNVLIRRGEDSDKRETERRRACKDKEIGEMC